MTATKLKASEVAEWRKTILSMQQNRCKLCKLPCAPAQAVLDHCHSTGYIRGVLHRSCNALLGKVENNFRRYGVQNLAAWAAGMPGYLALHDTPQHPLLHPTFKTADEKRLARNAKARKARATRKAA